MSRLKELFSRTDLDAVLIMNSVDPFIDPNFFYFTCLKSGAFEVSSALVRQGSVRVLTGRLEYETAKKQVKNVSLYKSRDELWKKLKSELSGSRVGLNYSALPVGLYKKLKKNLPKTRFMDVSKLLEEIRMVKDREEISLLSKAAAASSKVAQTIPSLARSGMTETELKAEIDMELGRRASGTAFPSIIASGPNSADPHHTPGSRKIRGGDFLLCDFGASVDRYCSDITRTFFMGICSDRQRKMYYTVLDAQQLALDAIRPGAKASDIHKLAADYIAKNGFKGRFTHSLGHMVGLTVHDGPSLNEKSSFTLKEGMVFTVEPGIYIQGYGGVRIEDTIVVTRNGYKILTPAPKEMKLL